VFFVVTNHYRLAERFWRKGDDSVANALIASMILDTMCEYTEKYYHLADERNKMTHNARKFEDLAVGVLQASYHVNPDKVSEMLEVPMEQFGNQNALKIASATKNLQFISNQAAQSVINSHWYGQMDPQTSFFWIIFIILMPLMVFKIKLVNHSNDFTDDGPDGAALFSESHSKKKKTSYRQHTYRKKAEAFFCAPFVRFWIDALAFLGLLFLHSYVTLTEFGDSLSVAEYVLLIWFVALAVEEIRQAFFTTEHIHKGNGYFQQLWADVCEYANDPWNRLDMTIISIYTAAFLFRVSDLSSSSVQVQSKAIFALNSILLFWRLARYYAVSSILGPKLIMMRRMIWDVLTFSCLIIIFLLGYGIASQALLFPSVPFDRQTVLGSFYRPYFQIFGELFLDDLQDLSSCVGPWPFSSCDAKITWLIPILLGLYLLITNILLINLLIAFMNQTYVEVQEKSRQLWNFQNLELYFEYKKRPLLPAPLILLNHIFLVMRFFLHKGKELVNKQEEDLSDEQKERIRDSKIFQAQQTERYLIWKEKQMESSTEYRIMRTADTVSSIRADIDTMGQQQTTLRQTLERRQHYTNMLISKALKTGEVTYQLPPTVDAKCFEPGEIYPHSDPPVRRAEVRVRSHKSDDPNYWPVEYTSTHILNNSSESKDPSAIKFNTGNRTSIEGPIEVRLGRPMNPRGRTGITGRGDLFGWGPNQAVDIVLTRWKRLSDGSVMEREGRRVIEFVCILRVEDKMRALPGTFKRDNESDLAAGKRVFFEKVIRENPNSPDYLLRREEQALLLDRLQDWGAIFVLDKRNTDNAWVESKVFAFHDEDGMLTYDIILREGVMWMVLRKELQLFANHMDILQAVCHDKESSW
jgi:transient receptor potential cation channel subfamily M protein 2